ncbi:hypothetical protein [Lysobacter gummosus]
MLPETDGIQPSYRAGRRRDKERHWPPWPHREPPGNSPRPTA